MSIFSVPNVRYAKSDAVNIAYQVLGDGPRDLVHVPPFISNLDLQWEDPAQASYLRRLASFSRLIAFDKRGTGLSDRVAVATVEERMDDVRAVMDAANSERAVVFGSSEGGALALLFAVTYPERVSALVLYGAYPRLSWAPDYPEGVQVSDGALREFEDHWGEVGGGIPLSVLDPGRADDVAYQEAWARQSRLSASPGAAVAILSMALSLDVRDVVPAVRVPTLVVYRTADVGHAQGSRYLGLHIPGAKTVELPGSVYFPYLGDQEAILSEVEEFITGVRPPPLRDRVLATVLFTDIVSSTELLAQRGDHAWRRLLDHHDAAANRIVADHRGRVVKHTGDGILATFDGPARAVRCGAALIAAAASSGITLRAGLHTGEIELRSTDVAGIAVHIASRIAALADPNELLVSRTVVDLTAGSGLEFAPRGEYHLKGVPGTWPILAAQRRS
jgi:class 3 adenylate cyclase/pimeloyl-ACP methyl ester carboxylesterase